MKINKTSRITALVMAVVMLFTMTGVASFADEDQTETKEEKKLVVIGASTANGYGLPDFVNKNNGFDVNNNDVEDYWTVEKATEEGRGRFSAKAYPWRLKKYLEEKEGTSYDLSSFALNGMRTNELRAILDEDYYVKAFEDEKSKLWYYKTNDEGKKVLTKTGFLTEHINTFVHALGNGGATVEENGEQVPVWTEDDDIEIDGLKGIMGLEGTSGEAYRRAQKYVSDEIRDADVIVVDNVMNNFGTYLAHRVGSSAGAPGFEASRLYAKQTLEDIDDISGTTWKQVGKLKDALLGIAGLSENPLGAEMINAFVYCYADAVTNFSAEMDIIRELNPDAKILVVGPYNSLEGVNLKFGEQTIPFGDVAGKAFDMVSAYLKAVDKHSNDYYYVDLSESIETFMTKMASFDTYDNFMKDEEGRYLLNNMYGAKVYGGDQSSFMSMFLGTSDPELLPDVLAAGQFDPIDLSVEPDEDDYMTTFMWTYKRSFNKYLTEDHVLTEAEKDPSSELITWRDLRMIQSLTKDQINERTGSDDGQEKLDDINSFINVLMNGMHYEGIIDQDGIIDMIPKIEPAVKKMLFDAAKVDTLDLTAIASSMQDVNSVKKDLMAVIMNGAEPSDSILALFHILDRFLLYMSVGQHPDEVGCGQIYDKVVEAYEKEDTAYTETKSEIMAKVEKLIEELRKTNAKDDIDAMIEKINQIQAALDMIDEAKAGMEDLKRIQEIKAEVEEYVGQILDELGLDMDDVIEKGKVVADGIDPVWVAEQIKQLNDIIMNWPELQEEYKARIEEYVEKLTEALNKTIDELIKQKDAFEDSEFVKKVIETIEVLRDFADGLPKSEEEFKDFIVEQLERAETLIEDAAASISQDLADQIKEIADKVKEAVTKEDYQAIIDELMPIGQKLLAIGEAVAGLPEYEAAMNEYIETSNAAMAGLQDRVKELERMTGKLQAKYVKVDMKVAAAFGAKSSKINVTWDADENAAGYVVKVDGKEVEAKETETGLSYEQTGIKVGQTYPYEITPYVMAQIDGETETFYGKTYKKTFVPKVSLKKVTLKKAKAAKKSFKATWKKVTGADGYQLSYKLGKKTKYKTVKGAKKVSLKVKKLKSGKKYTIKVRAYKIVNGDKCFGKWSKSKKTKVK